MALLTQELEQDHEHLKSQNLCVVQIFLEHQVNIVI